MNKRLKKKSYKYALNSFYSKVGLIANLSSMIEYNLILIVSEQKILLGLNNKDELYLFEYNSLVESANNRYRELSSYSKLQQLIKEAIASEAINKEVGKELEKIRKERNYYIHELFIEDLRTKHLFNNPSIYFKNMDNLISKMSFINECLVSLDRNKRSIINSYH